MANTDKNILITPNTGSSTNDPTIVFTGADASGSDNVNMYVTFDGTVATLSYEGSAGQLFSVSNDLSGTIFAVNDVSGIPSIEVDDDGEIRFAEFAGNVLIGYSTDQGTGKLQVNGLMAGTATSAQYADLAERYETDWAFEPATVMVFGGDKEVTESTVPNDHRIAGVVSTDPAYMMNSHAGNDQTHPYIALTGRVPCQVVGPVEKGDLIVTSDVQGHAMANNNARAGTIIGKAIERCPEGQHVIEVLVTLS